VQRFSQPEISSVFAEMTKMDDTRDQLTLRVGIAGKGVNFEGLIVFFQDALAALQAIDKDCSLHGAETREWEVIQVGSNSPIFATVRPRPLPSTSAIHNEDIAAIFVSGVEELNRGNRPPRRFGKVVLLCVKKMASTATRYGLQPIISTRSKQVPIEDSVASNADYVIKTIYLEKTTYREYGSLRGMLKAVAGTKQELRDKVLLVDRLTGDETKCYIKGKDLEEKVREGWKKRVVLSGEIVVDRKTRKPRKMLVQDVRILPDRDSLPQLEDLRGIDITGGVSAAEYVRRLRDD
jgi:hypothetical protein